MCNFEYADEQKTVRLEMLYFSEQEARLRIDILNRAEWMKRNAANYKFSHAKHAIDCFNCAESRNRLNESSEVY